VGELQVRYKLPASATDKQDKGMWLRMMDDDLQSGRFVPVAGSDLHSQMGYLPWDDDKKREHEDYPCDAVDAGLYAWRYCMHHVRSAAEVPKPEVGSDAWARKEIARIARKRDKKDPNNWY